MASLLPTAKSEPSSHLADYSALIYGPTKIGKSTWCSNAPDALFLSTEPGLNSLSVYQAPIRNWEELLMVCSEIAKGEHQFRTLVLDTIDNAYDMCTEHVCKAHKVEHAADLPYGKGFTLINNEFRRVITRLAHLPYGLYLISHSQDVEVETRTGKITRTLPTLPDKARKIVLGLVDMVLYCDLHASTDADGQQVVTRVMRTKPSRLYEAGDRTGRLPDTIELDYSKFAAAFGGTTIRKEKPHGK